LPELARGFTPREIAGEFGLSWSRVAGRIVAGFRRQLPTFVREDPAGGFRWPPRSRRRSCSHL
jgi:hypothetical protein